MDRELEMEKRELENERRMSARILKSNQEHIAEMLKGEMGNDMKDVIQGKKFVRESFFKRLTYKINYYIERMMSII